MNEYVSHQFYLPYVFGYLMNVNIRSNGASRWPQSCKEFSKVYPSVEAVPLDRWTWQVHLENPCRHVEVEDQRTSLPSPYVLNVVHHTCCVRVIVSAQYFVTEIVDAALRGVDDVIASCPRYHFHCLKVIQSVERPKTSRQLSYGGHHQMLLLTRVAFRILAT